MASGPRQKPMIISRLESAGLSAMIESSSCTMISLEGRRRARRPFRLLGNHPKRHAKFVPDLCQNFADLAVLGDLAQHRTSNLRGIRSGRRTDSVPGHHVFSSLQTASPPFMFHSVPTSACIGLPMFVSIQANRRGRASFDSTSRKVGEVTAVVQCNQGMPIIGADDVAYFSFDLGLPCMLLGIH